MAENFPNLKKYMYLQILEAPGTIRKNPKRATLRHIIIKLLKDQQRENLERSKRKATHHAQ